MKKLSSKSWGNFKSTIHLVNRLIDLNDAKQRRKVGSLIDFYLLKLKHLEAIHDSSYEYFSQILLRITEQKVKNSHFDPIVTSKLLSTIKTFHREGLKKYLSKSKYYRLKIQINEKSLIKNRLFKQNIKVNGINIKEEGKEKFIVFNNTEYFEKIMK